MQPGGVERESGQFISTRVTAMSENLNAKSFAAQLQTQFTVRVPDGEPIILQLYEVAEQNPSPHIEYFSLFFRGPLAAQCKQGIHFLRHEKLGSFDLFLVPIGPDAQGMRYQAVFNRLRERNS
jgi:hypothetical protein